METEVFDNASDSKNQKETSSLSEIIKDASSPAWIPTFLIMAAFSGLNKKNEDTLIKEKPEND